MYKYVCFYLSIRFSYFKKYSIFLCFDCIDDREPFFFSNNIYQIMLIPFDLSTTALYHINLDEPWAWGQRVKETPVNFSTSFDRLRRISWRPTNLPEAQQIRRCFREKRLSENSFKNKHFRIFFSRVMSSSACEVYTAVKCYLRFFFFVGQSPISTMPKENSVYIFIPAFISMALNSAVAGIGIYYRYEYMKRTGKVLGMISNANFTLELLTGLMILSQPFLHRKAINQAIAQFRFLSGFFRKKFNRTISPAPYIRSIKWLIWTLCLTYVPGLVLCFAPRSIREWRYDSHTLEFIFSIMQISLVASTVHNVLYIDWIRVYADELNAVLKTTHLCGYCKRHSFGTVLSDAWFIEYRCNVCIEKRLSILRNAKLCYYRIWRVTRHVNDFFGLSIIAILLRSFSEGSIQVYGVYGVLISEDKKYYSIGPLLRLMILALSTIFLINSAQYLLDSVSILSWERKLRF